MFKKLLLILISLVIVSLFNIEYLVVASTLAGAYLVVEFLFYLKNRNLIKFAKNCELADEFKRNPRFIKEQYRVVKHNLKMNSKLKVAAKLEAKSDANSNEFKIKTQIAKAKTGGNKVSFKTKLLSTKLGTYITYRKFYAKSLITLGLKNTK